VTRASCVVIVGDGDALRMRVHRHSEARIAHGERRDAISSGGDYERVGVSSDRGDTLTTDHRELNGCARVSSVTVQSDCADAAAERESGRHVWTGTSKREPRLLMEDARQPS